MSRLINRNVHVDGRRTTMRLEPELWDAIEEICHREDVTLSDLVTRIDGGRSTDEDSRTSAVRVHILSYYRAAASDPGHAAAGHGMRHTVYA